MMFETGLSTAGVVSQISGRGVGMDAVRKFVACVGGSVEIKLLADSGDPIPFYLCLAFPMNSLLAGESGAARDRHAS